ncbi:unnamed protein product, partial [Thelazia callipaeda]|uniref:Protein YIPF n=1 Tax=Thelazia callipaeda TaxID=103827 RepID=A0A0N5CNV2_THECL
IFIRLDLNNFSAKRNIFSFEFYQQYFDIDTDQVLSRMLNSMVPKFRSNFISMYIQPFPDLWGPFWIAITLVFSTAICGNLAKYIEASGDVTNHQYGSDFRLVTGASAAIFCYIVLVPFFLYTLLWYRKSNLQYSYLDILCLYGYSLSVFIPTSILWVFQAQWFRWILIFLSVIPSVCVIVSSIWPAVKNDHNKIISFGTIISIIVLHSLLAVGFKEYYFDASLSSQLEIDEFHRLHQQVRNVEHMRDQLEIRTVENSRMQFSGDKTAQVKNDKPKDDTNIKINDRMNKASREASLSGELVIANISKHR